MKILKIALIAASLAVGIGGTAAEARDHNHGYNRGYHHGYGGPRYRHWERRRYYGYHRPYYRDHGHYRRHWR